MKQTNEVARPAIDWSTVGRVLVDVKPGPTHLDVTLRVTRVNDTDLGMRYSLNKCVADRLPLVIESMLRGVAITMAATKKPSGGHPYGT